MYDVAIIGAGAAGIGCAKAALSAGLHAVVIEKEEKAFGGTCLNTGCIPTKFFINSAKLHKSWQETFQENKKIIEKIKLPLLSHLRKQGLDVIWGKTKLLDSETIEVGGKRIEAKNIIIASGSCAKIFFDHPKVISAEGVFNIADIGENILIIGGGYIGLEMASLLSGLGKKVYVIEKEKTILPSFDQQLVNRLKVILGKQGIKIETGKNASDVNFDDFDIVISATGRSPSTDGLNLEGLGVAFDEAGWIKTDSFMKTNVRGIYACGDVTGKKLLAYAGEYQARICIDNIKGGSLSEDYLGLAECVFSIPALAKVGMSQSQAKQAGIKYKVLKSNFLKYSSAYVYDDLDGFIQVLVDQEQKIIGAGIISKSAGELISLFSLCIKNNLKLNDLKNNIFIHPTLSEIIPLMLDSD